jgi:hypothetical protein
MKHEDIAAMHRDLHQRRTERLVSEAEPTYMISLREMNTFIRALEVVVKVIDSAEAVDNM